VGIEVNIDDSVDIDISPLPHDNEDFLLVEKFLHTTQPPHIWYVYILVLICVFIFPVFALISYNV